MPVFCVYDVYELESQSMSKPECLWYLPTSKQLRNSRRPPGVETFSAWCVRRHSWRHASAPWRQQRCFLPQKPWCFPAKNEGLAKFEKRKSEFFAEKILLIGLSTSQYIHQKSVWPEKKPGEFTMNSTDFASQKKCPFSANFGEGKYHPFLLTTNNHIIYIYIMMINMYIYIFIYTTIDYLSLSIAIPRVQLSVTPKGS
jgi:hypothetical protein